MCIESKKQENVNLFNQLKNINITRARVIKNHQHQLHNVN